MSTIGTPRQSSRSRLPPKIESLLFGYGILVRFLIQPLLDPIAWCISRVRVNRVTFETVDGRDYVRKRRWVLGWSLILIGNIVFRFRRVPVKVLRRQAWFEWEQRVQSATGIEFPQQSPGGLLTQRDRGRLLADTLVELCDQKQIVEHLAIALAELYRLHQIEVEMDLGCGGKIVAFSHGDASVNNVIFDSTSETARWFDFDLRHNLQQSTELRRADDLRAFLFTAVQCLPPESCTEDALQRMLIALRSAYECDRIWETLVVLISSRWFALDLFHRAQIYRATTTINRKVEQRLKDALVEHAEVA